MAPDRLGFTYFDIAAKLPAGTTVEQYRAMLRNLADRFKLAVHSDRRDGRVFDLAVAKNGPKLKQSAAAK